MTNLQKSIKASFQKAQCVLITSHIRPDGDAIGSCLALALGFTHLGREVQVVFSDGIPIFYKNLPGFNLVTTQARGDFDLIICLDCSEKKRTGSVLDGFGIPDVVIDHHQTFTDFGRLTLIEPQAAATSSLLVKYMPNWGMPLTTDIATNLMTGLITDTIGFRTPSTSPEVLRQAATLLELGVDMTTVYFDNLLRHTLAEARYWGYGLAKLQQTDGIIWTTLSISDREAAGYEGNDDADLINVLSSIDDMKIAIVLVEQESRKTKISWRGLAPEIDVSRISTQFQGGGHKSAAGAEITGSLEEVQKKVLTASLAALQHSLHKR